MIIVRPARLSDLSTLAALERAAFTHPWSWWSILAGYLPGGEIRVIEVEHAEAQHVAGYALRLGKSLARLAVFPEYRRQGFGRILVQAVLQRSACLRVQVRAGNAPARALYADLGFCEVGRCRYRDGEAGRVLVFSGGAGENR